jgi:putative solute:sodium symporter small subunit
MNDTQPHDTTGGTETQTTEGTESETVATDGGTASAQETGDYLDARINLLSPSTGFMRDHLKLVWGSFIAWIIATWGPVTATLLATDTMTSLSILGFPGHYFLVAFVSPTSSLILAAIYAQRRDKLDEKYGIDTSSTSEAPSGAEDAATTDGGVAE